MSIGKVAVLAVALIFVSGGVGAALADWNDSEPTSRIDLVDVDARKDDAVDVLLATEEDEQDPDPAQGDGDDTAGNDGTAGGNNTEAAPAPAAPVIAGGGAGDTEDDAGAGAGAGVGAGGLRLERHRRSRWRDGRRRRGGGGGRRTRHGLGWVPQSWPRGCPIPAPSPGSADRPVSSAPRRAGRFLA